MSTEAYVPKPLDTSGIQLPTVLSDLAERLAENVHEVWAAQRLADGWLLGTQRDDVKKTHPCLVPYDHLTETEKVYDRRVSIETVKMILALGFRILPPP